MLAVIIFLQLYFTYACPDNCFCTTDTLECTLNSCDTDFFYDAPVTILHGKLCNEQRNLLAKKGYDTQLILTDDTCDALPDCRLLLL